MRHETINDATDRLQKTASQITELANAFYRTGNMQTGDELHGLAGTIRTEATRIVSTAREWVHDQFLDAQKNTASMLSALAAGARLAEDKHDAKP